MTQTNDESLKKWIIYMYTFPNGKRYIGKTHRELHERQGSSNFSDYMGNTLLWKAIKKYGADNIKQDILVEDYMSDEQSSLYEMHYIAKYKTNYCRYNNPSYGYNLTDGGEGAIGFIHTDEEKQRMHDAKMGKYGKDSNCSKLIYCIELDKYFYGAREAERETCVSHKAISNCLRHISKSTLGGITGFDKLHWLFDYEVTPENIEKTIHSTRAKKKCRRVFCVELNKIFSSVKEASTAGYGTITDIYMACYEHRKITRDLNGNEYHWMYADEINLDEINDILCGKLTNNACKSVYCVEYDRYFPSITQVEKELGVPRTRVCYALKHSGIVHLDNGCILHFEYTKQQNNK